MASAHVSVDSAKGCVPWAYGPFSRPGVVRVLVHAETGPQVRLCVRIRVVLLGQLSTKGTVRMPPTPRVASEPCSVPHNFENIL